MRLILAVLVLTAGSTLALADKKIVDMTPLFAKESAGCEVQASGLVRISTGAGALVAASTGPEKAELEADAAKIAAGLAQIKEYCFAVESMVAFLKDNAKASYRSVEKELDQRDNKIRKQRAAAKKLIAGLAPVTKKLIPLIAKHKVGAPVKDKLPPAKFPSGRTVELPVLPGTWKLSGSNGDDTADYADKKTSASITARAKLAVACNQYREILAKSDTVENLVDAEIPSGAKDLGIAYRITYVRREKSTGPRFHTEICAEKGNDVYRVSSMVIPAANTALAEQLVSLMIRMLVAQTGDSPPKS